MNTKKYLQTDSAWSGLGCPAYPCYIGRDGCGLVSIANILIEMEQYAQYTPATIQPYCKKFMASDCEGTIWSGVPVMLKHYGLTDVMEHQNFSTLWPELAKGNRVVFYIMGPAPGGSKRVKWTSGGHCVCSVDYKYEDGLHKVYMKDSYSDSPLRNKWISYEENIRGACLAIWSGKLVGTPTPPPTPPKPGELVVDGICGTDTVMAMEQFFKVEIDGEISGQLAKWKNYYPSITAISFSTGGSRVIYKLQEWLNLSDPDGILGPNTTKAWQKRLRDYGYFANPQETIDGIIGAKTMKAWQECLNNGCKPKGSPTPPTPTPTKKTKMIDVSDFQSNIDWNKVKADGIDAAIIRVGGRGGEAGVIYDDSDFFENIKGAHKAGLSVGIYFLTQAITPEEGREEAQRTIKRWTESGIPISYPIGIDSEDASWKNPDGTIGYGRANSNKLSKAKRTAAIKAFADECKRQGYPSMLYASTNWLYDDVDMSVLSPLMNVWCAQWASSCSYTGKYIIWQYSSSGAVSGIKGRVDMDWCYVDPKQMNPPTPTPTPTPSGGHYTGAYPLVNRAKLIVDMAIKLAWAKGTAERVYRYPSGSAKKAFQNALNSAYPEHRQWGAAPSVGASCDVFVGTVVRSVGIDKNFPRGLQEQFEYSPKWANRLTYSNIAPISKVQYGDLVMFEYDSGAHIIVLGKDDYYEANYQTYFGHTNSSFSRIRNRQNKTVILRPKNYLEYKDSGSEVLKLQKYLNWYFRGKVVEENSYFGTEVRKYVRQMQADFFGAKEADGKVGEKTIAKMKEVVR